MKTSHTTCIVTLLLCLFYLISCNPTPVFPGKEWSYRNPESLGLNPNKLMELSNYVSGVGCIVRNGYMVHTWRDITMSGGVASAQKPVLCFLLLKAVEDGLLQGLDEKVANWEPRLATINADLGHKDVSITFQHMVNQTSCYGVTEKPGTAFNYNDYQLTLLQDTLFTKIYKSSYDNIDRDVFHPKLTDILQCQDDPTYHAYPFKPGKMAISPRDFARFGLLYLNNGKWRDEQVLSSELITSSISNPLPSHLPITQGIKAEMIDGQRTIGSNKILKIDHRGSYSYLWWTNGIDRNGKRLWPDAPADTYGAFGRGGNALIIIPSQNIVACWVGSNARKRWREDGTGQWRKVNKTLALLMKAVE